MNEQIESMSKQIYYWTSLNEQSFATIDSVEERFAETATNMAIIKQ